MRRNRLQADNVDELMEIVRALQRGEEPTQESIRKKTESVPKADSPKSNNDENVFWDDEKEFRESESEEKEQEADEKEGGLIDRLRAFGSSVIRTKKSSETEKTSGTEKTDETEEASGTEITEETEKSTEAEMMNRTENPEITENKESTKSTEKDKDAENSEEASQKPSQNMRSVIGKARSVFSGFTKKVDTPAKDEQSDEEDWEEDSFEESLGRRRSAKRKKDTQTRKKAKVNGQAVTESAAELIDSNQADTQTAESESTVDSGNSVEPKNSAMESVETENSSEEAAGENQKKIEAVEEKEVKSTNANRSNRRERISSGGRTGFLRRDSILNRSEYEDDEREPVDPESRGVFDRLTENAVPEEKKIEEDAGSDVKEPETVTAADERQTADEAENPTDSVRDEKTDDPAGQSDREAENSTPEAGTGSGRFSLTGKRRRKTAEEKEEEALKGFPLQKRTFSDYLNLCREKILGLPDWLKEKGITRRELGMIGAALVFAVLVVILVFRLISGSVSDKKKSENVTADDGLKVTVESEPENWTNSYPVQLKFSVAQGAQIESISIDGTDYTPDENGIVTVITGNYLLEASVETDQGRKTAQIVIPKLDQEAPIVHAALKNGMIELTAADSRSSVRGLYYAEYRPHMLGQLPEYQTYSEPIAYTEGMTYLFFADDAAGNHSTPIVTNMESAEKLILSNDEITLFEGETEDLQIQASPSGAVLNNLQFESMNPDILSVDSSGRVTALALGTGAVKISADDLEDVICTVTVTDTRTVKVSAVGDCTLGTDSSFNTTTNFTAYYTVNGPSYFFQNVKSILEEDDVTFANFEGTLTDSETRENKQYAFKGDPSYTEILKNGSVEVVTLANNHSSDYGSESLTDTEEALAEAEIDSCNGDRIVMRDVNGAKTAFIGIYVLNDGMGREQQVIDTVTSAKESGASVIVVAFHWGSEKANEPDSTQQSLAHTAIDSGADLVVGHHPHVLQGIEKYNGKYIAYSLGNFCFGGNSAPSDMDTIILQETFTLTKDGETGEDQISIVPCTISSESSYNNYQPTPAEGEKAASIIARMNELSAPFGVSIDEDGVVSAEETV